MNSSHNFITETIWYIQNKNNIFEKLFVKSWFKSWSDVSNLSFFEVALHGSHQRYRQMSHHQRGRPLCHWWVLQDIHRCNPLLSQGFLHPKVRHFSLLMFRHVFLQMVLQSFPPRTHPVIPLLSHRPPLQEFRLRNPLLDPRFPQQRFTHFHLQTRPHFVLRKFLQSCSLQLARRHHHQPINPQISQPKFHPRPQVKIHQVSLQFLELSTQKI